MKRSILLILFAAMAATCAAQTPEAPEGVWIDSYQAGMTRARAEKKPAVLVFHAEWCGPCRLMERETYANPEVMALLKPFVLIRVDIDREEEAAFAWRISGIPRVIMLNVHGQVIGDQLGFVPPEDFSRMVRDALQHVEERLPEAPMAPDALPSEARLKGIERELEAAAGEDSLTSAVAALVSLPTREERLPALAMLERQRDRVRPVLLGLLADARLAVRVGALEGLKSIGSAVPDYDPWAPGEMRRAALDRLASPPVAPASDR